MRRFAPVLALGVFVSLCGIQWGLPGPGRFVALPPGLAGDTEAAQRLAAAWDALYKGIEKGHHEGTGEPVTSIQGVEEIAPGWTYPPDRLIGSVRSTLLRSENPDEQKTLTELARMRPKQGRLKPLFAQYGGSFLYLVGAFLWLSAKAHLTTLVPGTAYYLLHPQAMGRLFLAGRVFMAVFFLGSLWLVFDLASLCAGEWAGVLAGVFYALCPTVVVQSHLLKPHLFASFWVLAAVRLAAAALSSGRSRDYLLCGLCAGVGAAASFPMLAFAALAPAAALLRGRREDWAKAAAGAGLCAAVFAAANPYFFLAHGDYVWETTVYAGGGASSLAGVAAFFGRPLAQAMGGLLEALCALGLWQAWRSRGEPALRLCAAVLAGGAVVLALAIGLLWGFAGGPGTARFFFPLFGLACVVAAAWACAPGARALRLALAAAAVLELCARSGVYLRNLAADSGPSSTRALAAAWIDSHVPDGAAVGLSCYPQPSSTPLFRYDRHRLVVFQDPAEIPRAERPPFMVLDSAGRAQLERRLPGRYELARAFEPRWTALAPMADDSFFANAPMYVYRLAGSGVNRP